MSGGPDWPDSPSMAVAISAGLDALIQAAIAGDKRAAKDLHKHIHAEIEQRLDDRLADYVAAHGLPAKGKGADSRDLALAFAVAFRMHRGESWGGAIDAVAESASIGAARVKAVFAGDMRKTAEEWVRDPDKRLIALSMSAKYL